MTTIRVGIKKESSQVIEVNKPFKKIGIKDVWDAMGHDKEILGWVLVITKDLYRDALHIYLKHAYPDDDEQYYSKWAFLVPSDRFFKEDLRPNFPFPTEVRFGCHVSWNTKLRCYETGFMFDTNHSGDPQDVIDEVKRIEKVVEDEWRRNNIPVHGDVI